MNKTRQNFTIDYGNGHSYNIREGWEELHGFYTTQETSTKRYFTEIIKKNWNIIDVGANIGMYSVLFANLSDGDIFCIEGSEVNTTMLEQNLAKYLEKRTNIQIHNVCVGDVDQIIENSTIHYLWTGRGSVLRKNGNLDFKKIDTLLQNYDKKIDLIKIDVDGWDFETLKGCERIIKKDNPLICLELVEETLKMNGHTSSDVLDYLKNTLGYVKYTTLDTDNYIFEK